MGILNQGVKKPVYDTSTTTGVIPAAVTGTGQFTVSGVRVTGIASAFDTEVKNGDYLYSTTLNEVREVKHILNVELIELATAFSGGVPMDNVNVVRRVDMSNILQVGILNDGATDGTVEESTLTPSSSANFNDTGGVGPLTFDATGTTFAITQKLKG
jgi:hypothetical protein